EPSRVASSGDAEPAVPAPTTLVVRLPDPAGDVVLSTPVLRAMRRALPATRIVWAGQPANLSLLAGVESADATAAVHARLAAAARAVVEAARRGRRAAVEGLLRGRTLRVGVAGARARRLPSARARAAALARGRAAGRREEAAGPRGDARPLPAARGRVRRGR